MRLLVISQCSFFLRRVLNPFCFLPASLPSLRLRVSKPVSRFLVLFFMLIAISTRSVRAEERYHDFLQGLRDRNYFDYAILYLDQLTRRPSLPDEFRQVIPYERAITLRENARQLRNPEKQFELLDQAMAYLEQFSKENPNHPRSGDANLDRAQILLQKAEVEIVQSKAPANKGSRSDFQRRGRELIRKARSVLKLAFDQHETAFKIFPAYVDEQKDPQQHGERANIERGMLLESLSLAKCTYQEAQSYDASSREFKQFLNQAAEEFEKTHQKYRSQLGGLHARAWQGKCFDEQGDRQKALGIYNELLEHPGSDSGIQSLKAQTLLFKLNCLYSDEDFQAIVDLTEEWLKKNSSESKSQVGLGIQWEQARATEALGDNRGLAKADQERFWRQARTIAQQISHFPGEYRDLSVAMTQRLQGKLGGKEKKPEDFETASNQGRQAFDSAQESRKKLDSATKSELGNEELTRLKQDWTNSLNEAARNFELAMTFANRRDTLKRVDSKEIASARLMLAYTSFYLRRNYEAAVLAEYVARTTAGDDDNVALDAAFMTMAAFVQAYNDNKSPPDQKSDDMRLIVKAASQITSRWPESEKASEAFMVLGQMYKSAKRHLESADWFNKIPENDAKYPEAQLAAGQAYWGAYGAAARLPKDARPEPDQFTKWKEASELCLRTGISKLAATLPSEGSVPQELVVAKISLAEILLSQGKDADAATLLLDDPQSVVKAVAVDDETLRPEQGVKRRPIAKLTYIMLLRSYIGMGLDKLNDARATMKTLESIVAGDASSDLTELYVELGRMLKAELERFRSSGETDRVKKLTASFESFLDDMFKKQDGQTLGSLSWIGETYFALGEIAADGGKVSSYYDRAASAFSRILSRTQAEPDFATADQVLNVKVRLIHSNRLKKDFTNAEKLLTEVIKERGNDLRSQIEGASVYQDWGASGESKKLITAITGNKEIGLWGWVGIVKVVEKQPGFVDRPEMIETSLDARYGVSYCRFLYAKEMSSIEKQKELDRCATELISSSAITKTIPEEKRIKFNELYRKVLRESGKPVTNMPGSGEERSKPKEEVNSNDDSPKPAAKIAVEIPQEKPAIAPSQIVVSNNNTVIWIVIIGSLLASAGIVGWMLLKGGKPKRSVKSIRRSPAEVAFRGIAVEEQPPETLTPPVTAPKSRSKPASSEVPFSVPASPRPAKHGDASTPKPRPRPPSPPKDQ